jgi:hypothetical protein
MPAKPTSRKPKSGRVFGQRRKETKMFRVGLYARVSTLDQQTLPMQNRTMREYGEVSASLRNAPDFSRK